MTTHTHYQAGRFYPTIFGAVKIYRNADDTCSLLGEMLEPIRGLNGRDCVSLDEAQRALYSLEAKGEDLMKLRDEATEKKQMLFDTYIHQITDQAIVHIDRQRFPLS